MDIVLQLGRKSINFCRRDLPKSSASCNHRARRMYRYTGFLPERETLFANELWKRSGLLPPPRYRQAAAVAACIGGPALTFAGGQWYPLGKAKSPERGRPAHAPGWRPACRLPRSRIGPDLRSGLTSSETAGCLRALACLLSHCTSHLLGSRVCNPSDSLRHVRRGFVCP
jgi:hypothetical protein